MSSSLFSSPRRPGAGQWEGGLPRRQFSTFQFRRILSSSVGPSASLVSLELGGVASLSGVGANAAAPSRQCPHSGRRLSTSRLVDLPSQRGAHHEPRDRRSRAIRLGRGQDRDRLRCSADSLCRRGRVQREKRPCQRPHGRVPNGRPQSGGSACTAPHGITVSGDGTKPVHPRLTRHPTASRRCRVRATRAREVLDREEQPGQQS